MTAFGALVDSLWVRMPDLRAGDRIGAILVGNEVDAYLRTLGLRHHDGTANPAWQRLADAAAARGW